MRLAFCAGKLSDCHRPTEATDRGKTAVAGCRGASNSIQSPLRWIFIRNFVLGLLMKRKRPKEANKLSSFRSCGCCVQLPNDWTRKVFWDNRFSGLIVMSRNLWTWIFNKWVFFPPFLWDLSVSLVIWWDCTLHNNRADIQLVLQKNLSNFINTRSI